MNASVLGELLHERIHPAGISGLDVASAPTVSCRRDVFLPGVAKQR